MPVLPIGRDLDHRAQAGRSCVLAVWRVRRSVERRAPEPGEKLAGLKQPMAVNAGKLARDLQELIAALDRRLPGVAQAGEVGIARDAAALRAKAVKRLEELTDAAAEKSGREATL